MTHARQQIRDFVVAGLSNLATTGDRVYVGRTRSLPNGHEPALLIYTRAETSKRAVAGQPPILERPLTLHIEGRVQAVTPPDDLLDQISAEVEAGMAAMISYGTAVFFGGMVQNVELTASESAVKVEGEKHIGGVMLSYTVTYRTTEGSPSTLI